MDVGSREYIFAIELMTSVMELYNIKWKPKKTPFFVKLSPFTSVVKKAVEYIWREKNEFINDLFNTVLTMGTINMRNYKAAVEFAGHLVTEAEYDEIELLRYCVIASGYASLFYRNGLKDVPRQCIKLICDVIMSFRTKNEFTDESWADIEIIGEAYSVEPPFEEDFSNATSACLSQLSGNDSSDNFRQVEVYPHDVEKKYTSKTLHHKIKSSMQKGERNDVDSFNGHSTKSETMKISSKLLKPKKGKNKFEKTKSIKKKITNREDTNEKVAEKRVVKKFGSNKITTTIIAKNKDARDEIVASKYITAEVEEDKDDDKPNTEQQCKSLKVEHAKFKHKKISMKFKDFNAMDTINPFVKFAMTNNAVKGSEASNYVQKESEKINKAAEKVDKYNKVESETKNMGEEIMYETKKFKRIKQASDVVPKTYNADEVADAKETSVRAEITKTKKLKNKKHKRRKRANKTFKANKSTLYEGAYKRVEDTNFTLQENEEIEYSSDRISKTNNTNVKATGTNSSLAGAVVLKDTEKKLNRIKIKTKKAKPTHQETDSDMFKAPNVTPASKQIPKNVHETAVIIDAMTKSKYNRTFAETKYLTEEMKNVEHGAQISDTKLIVKDVQSAENIEASRKDTAKKIQLVKYKTTKFKDESYKNKNAEGIKHKVKADERIIDSLEESLPTNPVSEHSVKGIKNAAEKNSKKVKVTKKKTKIIKNKKLESKNVYNKTSYKEVTETMYTSDEYVDVETIDEEVAVVSKNVDSKKNKHNTKSVKKANIYRTSTGKYSKPRRHSTREKFVNPLVSDLIKEEHQSPSTSNKIEPTWKDPNSRNAGCEISNLINVSANENSMSIFLNTSQEKASSEIRDQESENKDPIHKLQPHGLKEVPLEKATSYKTCNITHSREIYLWDSK